MSVKGKPGEIGEVALPRQNPRPLLDLSTIIWVTPLTLTGQSRYACGLSSSWLYADKLITQDISDLRRATIKIWEQAGEGETTVVAAAFITNAACTALEEIEQRLNVFCGGSDPDILQRKLIQMQDYMQDDLDTSAHVKPGGKSNNSQQVEDLNQAWNVLMSFKRQFKEGRDEKRGCIIPKPSQVVLRIGPDSAAMDQDCLAVILQNIGHHVQSPRRPTCIVRQGSPVYAELGYLLTHDESDSNGLRCCFGLELLLESYKAYLSAAKNPSAPSSCRLQALRFAQEAIPYLGAVLDDASMPCRCCHTLAFHMEKLLADFKTFLQQNVFDLYFQSPWVSGSHMLEMLELLFYHGLRLFSYRHYVGSVLHIYNALRECTGFETIPLLEQLCTSLGEILFPGGRPKRNFKACCFRYMGGRLRFNQHASDHKSGSHKMCIPARTAEATAGFNLHREANDSRFDYRKVSLLHHIKERGYHLDPTLWAQVHQAASHPAEKQQHRPSCKKGRSRRRPCCSPQQSTSQPSSCAPLHQEPPPPPPPASPPHPLHILHKALQLSLTGPFPPTRINFFAIYLACIRIVRIISHHAHPPNTTITTSTSPTAATAATTATTTPTTPPSGADAGTSASSGGANASADTSAKPTSAAPCLCFLDAILEAADRYCDPQSGLQPFGCRVLVAVCGRAIREVLAGREVREFLWGGGGLM
jgi:hypothetical protein